MSILKTIFGDSNSRSLEKLKPILERVNELEKEYEKIATSDLPLKTAEFKERLEKGETLDDILPEAFALVRESAKRTLGQRHFDVQILGGIVLHQGKIAEMKTGEGKTLVATLPAYLNALAGAGVHIVTVNDYLSRRDAVWMGQIYYALGLSVGCLNHEASYLYDPLHTENPKSEIRNSKQIQNSKSEKVSNFENSNLNIVSDLDIRASTLDRERDVLGSFKVIHEFLRPCTRREAYEADITYGTNNEFGFDYLRDNMVYPVRKEFSNGAYDVLRVVQRTHHYAIIDEVDSILIDEARTPLIISAPDTESEELYYSFSRIVPQLEEGPDYNVDEKMKAVSITEKGIDKVEKILGVKDIYTEKGIRYVHHLKQALRAETLFKRDRDYVVKNGEVIIVDEFTGRLMPGRRWSEGLHQAIEAKENVTVQKESRTLATITFQNYFRMYEKLAGMTGTAQTSAEEFFKVYKLDVVSIPTNKPMIRKDLPDKIFQTEKGKFRAIIKEIKERHQKGEPILVGTISIEKNELLGAMLQKEGISHNVLNAKNHEREAEIIAQAGRVAAVTIATNMAGRGVDIMLGGHAPSKLKTQNSKLKINEADLDLTEEYKDWQKEYRKVVEAGGLFVLGTERHEARRIDNQLRGRSGRQGDPGQTQFFVSLEDDLMRIFGSERIKNMLGRFGIPEDEPIEHKFISKAIESAQAKIEGMNFDARKHVLEYDDVMNHQRSTIYSKRKKILLSNDAEIIEITKAALEKEVKNIINFHTQAAIQDWNLEEIAEDFQANFGRVENLHQVIIALVGKKDEEEASRNKIRELLRKIWQEIFNTRLKNEPEYPQTVKTLFLQTIDMFWTDHLEMMEHLRSSVGLRAYGQRDPLVEYKNEGIRLFRELDLLINAQVARLALRISSQPRITMTPMQEAHPEARILGGGKGVQAASAVKTSGNQKVGRNDPCPCGATHPDGRPIKYKHCHGK